MSIDDVALSDDLAAVSLDEIGNSDVNGRLSNHFDFLSDVSVEERH